MKRLNPACWYSKWKKYNIQIFSHYGIRNEFKVNAYISLLLFTGEIKLRPSFGYPVLMLVYITQRVPLHLFCIKHFC